MLNKPNQKIGQEKIQNPQEKKKKARRAKIKSWYSNRYQIVAVQRNILLFFTLLLLTAMTASIIFVKFVVSSKSLEPYIIEVEEKSGIPTVVEPLTIRNLTADESIKRYFIYQFVNSALTYNPKTYLEDAKKVRLFSTQAIYNDFRKKINNKKLGAESKIDMRIKSFLFENDNTAQIRILRSFATPDKNEQKDEVVEITFYFTNLTLTTEERFINPLGFQVVNFTVTEEIFQ